MPTKRDLSNLPERERVEVLRKRRNARESYRRNKESGREKARNRYYENRERGIAYSIDYRNKNRNRVNEYRRARAAEERKEPLRRIAAVLRSRISNAMARDKHRPGSAVKDLGCTFEELRAYLEERFTSGMCWENYGRGGWHIDHKIPLALFDLTDREQFLRAVHYTNLQPKWGLDNVKKGTKLEPPTIL